MTGTRAWTGRPVLGACSKWGLIASAISDASDGQTQITTAPAVSHIHHTRETMTVTLTITNDSGGAATGRLINVLPCGRLGATTRRQEGRHRSATERKADK